MRERIKDLGRLRHILNSVNVLLANKDKYEFEQVKDDPIIFFGFVKHVEIIGEAVYMLTKEFRETHPQVNWRVIENMRHVLVHGYYTIDPKQVWDTIDRDIATLKPYIEDFIREEERKG